MWSELLLNQFDSKNPLSAGAILDMTRSATLDQMFERGGRGGSGCCCSGRETSASQRRWCVTKCKSTNKQTNEYQSEARRSNQA
eukprot:1011368-Prorocentrum_minimum.AAC.2